MDCTEPFAPARPERNVVSSEPSGFRRAKLPSAVVPTAVKLPPARICPPGCSASVKTLPFMPAALNPVSGEPGGQR